MRELEKIYIELEQKKESELYQLELLRMAQLWVASEKIEKTKLLCKKIELFFGGACIGLFISLIVVFIVRA